MLPGWAIMLPMAHSFAHDYPLQRLVGPNPNGYTTQHDIHAQFESAYVERISRRIILSIWCTLPKNWMTLRGYIAY